MSETCVGCTFFKRGYRLHGLKVPDWCDKHFHTQHHDDPACELFRPACVEDDHPLTCECPDCNPMRKATK